MFIPTRKSAAAVIVAAALALTACGESETSERPRDLERENASEQIRLALKNHPDFRVWKTIYGDYLGCPSSGFGPSVVYLKDSGAVYAMNGLARGNYKHLPKYEGSQLSEYLSACSSSSDELASHPVIAKASAASEAQPESQNKPDKPASSDIGANALIPPGTKHETLILDEVSKGYVTAKELEVYYYMKNRFETYIARDGKYDIDKHDPLVFQEAEAKFGLSKEPLSDIYWRLDKLHAGQKPRESVTPELSNIPVDIAMDRVERTSKNELEVTVTNRTKKNATLPDINLTFDLYKNGQKVGFQIVWLEELNAGTKTYKSLPIRDDFDTVEGSAFMNVDEMIKSGLRSAYASSSKRGETVVQLLQMKPYNVTTGQETVISRENAASLAQAPARNTAPPAQAPVQNAAPTAQAPAQNAAPPGPASTQHAATPVAAPENKANSSASAPASKAKPPKLPEGVLKPGAVGAEVKQLQEALLLAGEQLPKSGADGQYGKETVEAVKSLQSKFDLTPDGIYGSQTRQALQAKLTGAVQIRDGRFSIRDISLGMSGEAVVRQLGKPVKTEKDGNYEEVYIYPGMSVGVDGGRIVYMTHIADNPAFEEQLADSFKGLTYKDGHGTAYVIPEHQELLLLQTDGTSRTVHLMPKDEQFDSHVQNGTWVVVE